MASGQGAPAQVCNLQRAQGPEPLRGPQPPGDSSPGGPAASLTLGRVVTPPLPPLALPMGPDGSPRPPRRRPSWGAECWAGSALLPPGRRVPPAAWGRAAAWARLCPRPGVLQWGSRGLSAPPAPGRAPEARAFPSAGSLALLGCLAPHPAPAGRGRQRAQEAQGTVRTEAVRSPARPPSPPRTLLLGVSSHPQRTLPTAAPVRS